MKTGKLVSAAVSLVILSGCVSMPQNAEEFRVGIGKGSWATKHETFEVDRDYATVSATLVQKAEECLDARIKKRKCVTSATAGTSCTTTTSVFTPTVVNGAKKTEVHMQWRSEGSKSIVLGAGTPPEDGTYVTVVDVEPLEKGKTLVNIYGMSIRYGLLIDTFTHWTNGTNMGCPDLTTI